MAKKHDIIDHDERMADWRRLRVEQDGTEKEKDIKAADTLRRLKS